MDSLAMAVARRRSTASSVATNCARSRISSEFGVECSRMEMISGADDEENDDEEEEDGEEEDADDEVEEEDEATWANAELTRDTHAAPEPGLIEAPLPLPFRFGMSSASRPVAAEAAAESSSVELAPAASRALLF